MAKTGVLILNLGTPESPSTKDVKEYLAEFLGDGRVIDINDLGRFFLVNFIIAPFRAPKSAAEYEKLFKVGNGASPLLTYSQTVQSKLQQLAGDDFKVELAMRYGFPSMEDAFDRMEKENFDRIVIFPLYPQYASATTGSTIERAFQLINRWQIIPEVKTIGQFYHDSSFINLIENRTQAFNLAEYDHVLFSYHGLPERQIDKGHVKSTRCADCNCNQQFDPSEPLCYRNTCFETSRKIAAKIGLSEDQYDTVFQSRLGKDPWLSPYADQEIEKLGKAGKKKLLVFSPAFVADCLETLLEIGNEYGHLFKEFGGEQLNLVPSMNDGDDWVNFLYEHIRKQID